MYSNVPTLIKPASWGYFWYGFSINEVVRVVSQSHNGCVSLGVKTNTLRDWRGTRTTLQMLKVCQEETCACRVTLTIGLDYQDSCTSSIIYRACLKDAAEVKQVKVCVTCGLWLVDKRLGDFLSYRRLLLMSGFLVRVCLTLISSLAWQK